MGVMKQDEEFEFSSDFNRFCCEKLSPLQDLADPWRWSPEQKLSPHHVEEMKHEMRRIDGETGRGEIWGYGQQLLRFNDDDDEVSMGQI